jgi:hypothetical protein
MRSRGHGARSKERERHTYELHAKEGREEAKAKVDAAHVGVPVARAVGPKLRHPVGPERIVVVPVEARLRMMKEEDA